MLEAKNLNVMPICELDVYFNQQGRGRRTVSLHVDGASIYTLDVRPGTKPSSGKDTVGAFAGTDKRSLVAWIDPVSGDFISTDTTVYDALVSIPLVIFLGLVAVAALHLKSWIVGAVIGLWLVAITRRVLHGRKADAELEMTLRSRFRGQVHTTTW